MITCPKCGSTDVFGPYYRGARGTEHLLYICGRCGYTDISAMRWRCPAPYHHHGPTLDQKHRDLTGDDMARHTGPKWCAARMPTGRYL